MKTISKTKAVELMQNAGGRFFTATWKSKSGEIKSVNANTSRDSLTKHGYLRVKTARGNMWKSVDVRTLRYLKINGVEYKIRN